MTQPVTLVDLRRKEIFPATAMPDSDWWRALWPDPSAVMDALGIRAGMTVVDLCCGDGYFTAAIARLIGPARLIGVDLDSNMLEQAKAACREATNCDWVLGDARDLSRLIREPVDYVLIANTFHGVPEQASLARDVSEILKPGGHFGIVNWHPIPREQTTVLGQPRGPRYVMRMSPEQVRAVVQPAGFRLQEVVELPPYHYGAIFAGAATSDTQAHIVEA